MTEDVAALKQKKIAEMAALGEKASTCTACGLSQTRTKVVFGYGNPASPMMIVGEGPGATEDATGLPFVGKAGKLLDECLRDAGLKREFVYIANVLKCRACIVSEKTIANRPPTPEEMQTCVPLWLVKQIEIMQPRVILCLGAPSANTVIHRNFKITRERGQWFQSVYGPDAIAGLHPAYILRQHGPEFDQARGWLVEDIIAAKEKAKSPKPPVNLSLL